MKFLKERTLLEAQMDRQICAGGMASQRQGPVVSLALDTTQTFFKVDPAVLFPSIISYEIEESI